MFSAHLGHRTAGSCDNLVGGQILNVEEIVNFRGFLKPYPRVPI